MQLIWPIHRRSCHEAGVLKAGVCVTAVSSFDHTDSDCVGCYETVTDGVSIVGSATTDSFQTQDVPSLLCVLVLWVLTEVLVLVLLLLLLGVLSLLLQTAWR